MNLLPCQNKKFEKMKKNGKLFFLKISKIQILHLNLNQKKNNDKTIEFFFKNSKFSKKIIFYTEICT